MNNIAVTYSFGPSCNACVKHNNHAKLKILVKSPIPSSFTSKIVLLEHIRYIIKKTKLTTARDVHVRDKLSKVFAMFYVKCLVSPVYMAKKIVVKIA